MSAAPHAPRSLGEQLRRRKPIVFRHEHHEGQELRPQPQHLPVPRCSGSAQPSEPGSCLGAGGAQAQDLPTGFFSLPRSPPDCPRSVMPSSASAIPVSGSTYSYAYHSMGELVAVIIAGCVLLEYGVAAGAVAVGWSGYFNELVHSLFGVSLPTALSVSPIPGTDGEATGGLINLPAVILVLLCMLLLMRGASESASSTPSWC